MTADEMRVEITRRLGGDRVVVTGGLMSRTVEVYNGRERIKRVVGLPGNLKDALKVVLDRLRA